MNENDASSSPTIYNEIRFESGEVRVATRVATKFSSCCLKDVHICVAGLRTEITECYSNDLEAIMIKHKKFTCKYTKSLISWMLFFLR